MLLMLTLLELRPPLVLFLLVLLLLLLPPLLLLVLAPLVLLGQGVPIGGLTSTAMGMKMPRAIGKRRACNRNKLWALRQQQRWSAQPWQLR